MIDGSCSITIDLVHAMGVVNAYKYNRSRYRVEDATRRCFNSNNSFINIPCKLFHFSIDDCESILSTKLICIKYYCSYYGNYL